MKKIKLKKLIIPAVNAAAIAGILILSAAGPHSAAKQKYNFTAGKWQGDSSESYWQVSSFFDDDSGFDTSRIRSVRGQIMTALKNASYDTESGMKLFTDAYSADVGTAKIKCDTSRRADAAVTAVGGDFFYFHSFDLISGAYFSEEDTMQDGVVIDRQLAWEIYGSDDIAGKNIYINGVKCYISGVVAAPTDKASKKCMGDVMRAYVSYDTASAMAMNDSSKSAENGTPSFRDITSYECVLPQPVENFASKTMEDVFGTAYKGSVRIVSNTDRYTPSKRVKAFRKISESVIHDDGIKLPFWENASRMTEYKLSWLYAARRLLTAIPVLTLAWLAFRLIRLYSRSKAELKRITAELIDRIITKRRKNSAENA